LHRSIPQSVCASQRSLRTHTVHAACHPSLYRHLRADAITELVMAGGMRHQIVATFNKIRG
jgi:hypothetical protein